MGIVMSLKRYSRQLLSRCQNLFLRMIPPREKLLPDYPFYWRNTFRGRIRTFDEIPGPEPSFGEDGIWRSKISGDSIETILETQAKWIKKYGHVVREYVSKDKCIIHLLHPEDMLLVHMAHPKYILQGDTYVPKSRCRKDMSNLNACNWLAPSANTEWSFLSMPTGFESETYDFIRTDLEDVVDEFVVEMRSKLDENGEIDILPLLFRWAFESIGLITMSERLDAFSEDQNSDAKVALQKLKAWKDTAYRAISGEADEKNAEEMKLSTDFLSSYFSKCVKEMINDFDYDSTSLVITLHNIGWNQSTLTTFLMDFFQQGVHKLSYSMAYTLMNIAADSNTQSTARKELIKVPTRQASKFYTSKEKNVPTWGGAWWIKGIIDESLRLNPATYGATEISPEGLILGGYDIPSGEVLVFHREFACRLEKYFPEPSTFNPKRVISERHGGDLPHLPAHDCLYLDYLWTFVSSTCLMEPFSHALMTLLLSKLIRNFEISRDDEKVKIVRTFYNEPTGPIKIKLVGIYPED